MSKLSNVEPLTDTELLVSWQSGNDIGFDLLYKRYLLPLFRTAISKTNSREDAEEIVQITFLKFFQQKDILKTDVTVGGYLYVILKNQIFNYHRNQLVVKKHRDYLAHLPNMYTEFESELEFKDLQRSIELEIDKLPEKCKQVYILSRNFHLSNKEIAAKLCISENTVEQHMRKALGKLRIFVNRYPELVITFMFSIIKYLG